MEQSERKGEMKKRQQANLFSVLNIINLNNMLPLHGEQKA